MAFPPSPTPPSTAMDVDRIELAKRIMAACEGAAGPPGNEAVGDMDPMPEPSADKPQIEYLNDLLTWHLGLVARGDWHLLPYTVTRDYLVEKLTPAVSPDWDIHPHSTAMADRPHFDSPDRGRLVTLRCKSQDIAVQLHWGHRVLACTSVFHGSSMDHLWSFRHGVGLVRYRDWKTVAGLVAYLGRLCAEGPCQDPLHLVPPCGPQPSRPVEDPVLRQLAGVVKWYRCAKSAPRVLPPYALPTVAAFEAVNNMRFPADMVTFLTEVSRELIGGHVIRLCENAPDVRKDSPEVQEELAALGAGGTSSTAKEVVNLRRHGGTDSGRVIRRLNPATVWTPSSQVYTLYEALDLFEEYNTDFRRMAVRCNNIRTRVRETGVDVDMGPAWAAAVVRGDAEAEAEASADAVRSDGFEDDVADDSNPVRPGVMWLANFGCQCDVELVVRGPYAGGVIYKYQVDTDETDVIFPSFTSFVAVVINGSGWQEQGQEQERERRPQEGGHDRTAEAEAGPSSSASPSL